MNNQPHRLPASVHPIRTFAARSLILVPIFLGMGFAFRSEPHTADIDLLGANPENVRKINAYVDVVRVAQKSSGHETADQDVRAAAGLWIQRNEDGTLKTVYNEGYGDSAQSGVKGDVFSAAKSLSFALQRVARREAQEGHVDLAARDYVTAARMMDPVMYWSEDSVILTASIQRPALRDLVSIWAKVSPEVRQTLRPQIEALRIDETRNQQTLKADQAARTKEALWEAALSADEPKDIKAMDAMMGPARTQTVIELEKHSEAELAKMVDELTSKA